MMIVAGGLAKAAKEASYRPEFLLRLLLVDDGNGGRGVRNRRRRRRGGGGHHGHGRHHRRLLRLLRRRRRHAVRGRRLGRWRVRIYFGGGGRVLSISAGISATVLTIRWHDGWETDQLIGQCADDEEISGSNRQSTSQGTNPKAQPVLLSELFECRQASLLRNNRSKRMVRAIQRRNSYSY